MPYIYQHKEWPRFTWNFEQVMPLLAEVRHRQGWLLGRMAGLGFRFKAEATLQTLTRDVVKSSEIEGEHLNVEQVRSSIARRLGVDVPGLVPADREVEGIVEMMLDATQRYEQPLTKERLFAWHTSLFPARKSGNYEITVGAWRHSPMQVVSGSMGKEQVHFQAPDAEVLDQEMSRFLLWFNTEPTPDPVLKAALAHFWFVTIHPFDDGNGRIARAIADLQLARSDGSTQRFYSMSAQIRQQRKEYYTILESTQKGSLDITGWMEWFLGCLEAAIGTSEAALDGVLVKARFWDKHLATHMNDRQKLLVNKLLDGFEGKLNSTKWGKIAKCSHDTALRDINDLLEKKVLVKEPGAGKNTSYVLDFDGLGP